MKSTCLIFVPIDGLSKNSNGYVKGHHNLSIGVTNNEDKIADICPLIGNRDTFHGVSVGKIPGRIRTVDDT